jgi:DNA-binding XRE family transcriptional regulator
MHLDLRQYRDRLGISRPRVADMTPGVSKKSLEKWEIQDRAPCDAVLSLARTYGDYGLVYKHLVVARDIDLERAYYDHNDKCLRYGYVKAKEDVA